VASSLNAAMAPRYVGDNVQTKSTSIVKLLIGSSVVAASLWLGGCGGGTSNVITVSVTDSLGGVVVVGQADTITATVTGPVAPAGGTANDNVNWTPPCLYSTTPPSGSTLKAATNVACPTDGSFGTFSSVTGTTEIYTAPTKLPDSTTYPNLVLTITAVSQADTSKKGTFTITLDSGILVTINPTSATLALNETKLFTATLTTDPIQGDVTWGITNTNVNTGGSPSIAGTYTPTTPQCSPLCGSIVTDPTTGDVTYTAPMALPSYTTNGTTATNPVVQIYAIAKLDTTRVAVATINLVTGGPITFNSLWPTVLPQGGALADIFLNATNLTTQIGVTVNGQAVDASSGAVKVFFTPSTYGATAGPVSTGARLRLNATQLAKPGTYTVAITPSVVGNDGGGAIATHTFTIVPVRPGLVASNPDDIDEGLSSQHVSIDGGYYGPSATPIVGVNFDGMTLNEFQQPAGSDPRRLIGVVQSTGSTPGLLPISVTNTLDPANLSTVYSNISILPSYANASNTAISTTPLPYGIPNPPNYPAGQVFPPCSVGACLPPDVNGNTPTQNPPCGAVATGCPYPAVLTLGATTQPSAIAVDPILGYAAIAEAGTNTVQFLNLSTTPVSQASLTAAFPVANPAANNLPTGVAIDRNDCTSGAAGVCSVRQAIVAVVNYQAQTMSILTIPGGALLESIPLNNLIPPSQPSGTNANPSPNPYSVGIDPFTHRALVAFASTNAGFIVNLDQSQKPSICLPGFAPADGTSYCPVALVTLNTGTNPQIAFEPGAHLAYVSPGGQAGALSAVSLTNPSQGPLQIASAVRTANLVTVTMAAGMPDNIVPGTSPTILISGLPLGTAGSSFNGAFPVSTVLSNLSFTYVQTGPDDTATSTTSQQGFLTIGNDTITYAINPSLQGIDINPITHSAVLANPNAAGSINSGPQITFINSLDESLSSLSLCNDNNLAIVTPALACGPEQGISAVAYQPFTNTVVSLRYDLNNLYNNQISLLDPSALNRVTMVPTGQMAAVATSFTPPGSSSPLMLNGAIAVDPIHNLALAVNSGSGTITPLYLGNIKPLQIQSVSTPPVDATDGATTPALIAQSVLFQSSTPAQPVSGVQVFGRGFNGSSQVRLDGVPLPPSDVSYSSSKPNELDVTIPVTNGSQGILTAPHNFALDVANTDGTTSNVMDFRVVEAIPIPQCSGVNAAPGGVAIADDLVGTTKNYAVVTETACSQVGVISLNNDGTFGSITTIATGTNPTGVATIPRFGYAVVTNNAMSGTASILDLTTGTRAAGATTDVTVGSFPTGVAIEQETGLAVVANTSSNTATVIDLTPLKASPVGTLAPLTTATDQEPIAVAIDPDRGTNATGLAVITALNISSTPASGALDPIDISLATPAKVNTEVLTVDTIPSGIIFDPFASPATLFYAAVSDDNALISFNPDTGSTSTAQVGINPYSVAYNPQTSSILTVNSASNTISIIDSLTFQTKATIGIGGVSLFSAAIEPLSNLAVIADQANNRVLLFPMPH
jgi:hypothetical protein